MMIHIIIITLGLCAWNILNSEFDAYRILHQKAIAHGLNFGAYAVVCATLWYFLGARYHWEILTVYSMLAFTCRQITFDIPLNWRRGLKWDYVSPAVPPKAVMDQLEQKIFGKNGRTPVAIYSVTWALSLTALLWIFSR